MKLWIVMAFFFRTQIDDSPYAHVFQFPAGAEWNAVNLCGTVQHSPAGIFACFCRLVSSQVTEVLNAGNIDVTGSYPHPVSVVEYHQVVIALRRIIGHDGLFPFRNVDGGYGIFFGNEVGRSGSIYFYLSFQYRCCFPFDNGVSYIVLFTHYGYSGRSAGT